MVKWSRNVLWLLLFLGLFRGKAGYHHEEDYEEWGVKMKGGKQLNAIAEKIAKKYKLEVVRSVSHEHMPEFFHLRAPKGFLNARHVTQGLQSESEVAYAVHQVPHEVDTKGDAADLENMITKNSYYNSPKCRCHKNTPDKDKSIMSFVFEVMNYKDGGNVSSLFNDYRWPCQWQLYNCGQTGGPDEYDLDIASVWAKGITGKGMVISIIDDGVDYNNRDIAPNYDKSASFDFVEYPDKDGPLPYSDKPHGTSCAGIVAMAANNGYCGVGAVYEANVGGTDIREAASVIYNANYIDVYSNSWGPSDTGKLFRKPAALTATSFERGAQQGRYGKGSIHAFASGNGGLQNDHCGADGFSCSIYTIAVAASTRNGKWADYSEQCTCIMVTIPATDPHKVESTIGEQWMISPSLHEGCSNYFSGTSSVTPLGAAVFLMVLQANPQLTWRDVQYLIARTAIVVDPTHKDWQINGDGYHVHPYYGFGALNALHIVTKAEQWKNVGRQKNCTLTHPSPYRAIPSNRALTFYTKSNACQDTENQVLKLEHIQVILSYEVKCRGDISVRITSPCGTVSPLMNTRRLDDRTLLVDWPFMSVFHWGEDPRGTWKLEVRDNKGKADCTRAHKEVSAGHLWQYQLVLWGVKHQKRRHRKPRCDRRKVYDNLDSGNELKNKKLAELLTSTTLSQASKEILYEFAEDFSEAVQKQDVAELKTPVPSPKVTRPYAIPYSRVAMRIWRNTFPGVLEKSFALASYIVDGTKPDQMSSKQFDAVRVKINHRLKSSATTFNDDGEPIHRNDVHAIGNLILNRSRHKNPLKSKKEAAAILHNLSPLWHY